MSNYPPPQYGGGYGSHDQSNMPYLPPAYPPQYYPPNPQLGIHGQMSAGGNYNAYEYNNGVHSFGAIPPPGMSPVPLFQGWNADPVHVPGFTGEPQQSPYHAYNHNQHHIQQYPPPHQTGWVQPAYGASISYGQQNVGEGEYQDQRAASQITPPDQSTVRHQSGSRNEMYTQPSSYPEPEHSQSPRGRSHSSVNEYSPPRERSTTPNQRKSDSYSPHLSPIVGSHVPVLNSEVSARYAQPVVKGDGKEFLHPVRVTTSQKSQASPGVNAHNSSFAKTSEPPQSPIRANGTSHSRSLEEAKRNALGAVLNLSAYEVGFKTLIDEGFRQDIVAKIYDELKLSRTLTNSRDISRDNASPSLEQTVPRNIGGTAVAGIHGAALFTMPAVPTIPSADVRPPTVANPTPASTAKPSSAMSEKDRKIQAKLEEFRKVKEARSQKQAAEKATKTDSPSVDPVVALVGSSQPQEFQSLRETTKGSPPVNAQSNEQISLTEDPAREITVPIVPIPNDRKTVNVQPPKEGSSIPGLFLASHTSIAPTSRRIDTSVVQDDSKKRVLTATDLARTTSEHTIKRPFGHSRTHTNLVITVSEDEDSGDEDEDVAMDLDSDANPDSPTQILSVIPPVRTTSGMKQPVKYDSLQRKHTASSLANSFSATSSPKGFSKLANGSTDLERAESEIQALKRLIAEKESKRKLRDTPSGTQTPVVGSSAPTDRTGGNTPNLQSVTSTTPDAPLASQSHVDAPAGHLGNFAAAEAMNLDDSDSDTELHQLEEDASREIMLKVQEAEQKASAARELQAALAKLQADSEAAQEELQIARDKALQLQVRRRRRSERPTVSDQLPGKLEEGASPSTSIALANGREGENYSENIRPELPQEDAAVKQIPSIDAPSTGPIPNITTKTVSRDDPSSNITPPKETDLTDLMNHEQNSEKHDTAIADQPKQHHPPSFRNAAADMQILDNVDGRTQSMPPKSPSADVTSLIEELKGDNGFLIERQNIVEDSISGTGVTTADGDLEATLQEAIRAQVDSPSADEGEIDIEMDMSPASSVHHSFASEPRNENDQVDFTSPPGSVSDVGDDYEPPDATIDSPPFSPAQADDEIVILDRGILKEDLPLLSSDSAQDMTPTQPVPTPLGGKAVQDTQAAGSVNSGHFYTPYESPLKRFHSFRFHPQFRDEVAGGLRSLTFSNKIETHNELCRFESLGGSCNDTLCKELHFKDMNLPDDAILTALGSPDQFVGSRRDEFCAGLRALLVELRRQKIRDFNVIAPEILAYRAKFLADDSRILPLEGVTV